MLNLNRTSVVIALITCLIVPYGLTAQTETTPNKTEIQLIQADRWFYSKDLNANSQFIVGNIILQHDSAYLLCDTALLYKATNTVEAYSNVRIIDNDTINLYGDYLTYNGNTKIAYIRGNVRLVDPSTTLITSQLTFNRNTHTAYYDSGATITNGENKLVSVDGIYNTSTGDLSFHKDIVITNPDYILKSDTMLYNVDRKVVTAIDSTTIFNKDNTMFCRSGKYYLETDEGTFNNSVEIHYDNYILFSDSLYYENKRVYAEGYENVTVIDTTNKITSWSDYIEFNKEDGYGFISGNSKVRYLTEKDTMYILADTIRATFDSTLIDISAYNHVRLIHKDFQAVCDSLVAYRADSCVKLFNSPALWTGKNQITGDTVILYTANGKIDKLHIPSSGFIAAKDTLGSINQIKGNEISIYFKKHDNEYAGSEHGNGIDYVAINGNNQVVYFLRDDNNGLIGINVVSANNSKIIFVEGEMRDFIFYSDVKSDIYPTDKSNPSMEKLDGLMWREEERPSIE